MSPPLAGFLLALVTERCYFIDFPFYHAHFAHEPGLQLEAHAQRLQGSDANATALADGLRAMPSTFDTAGIADMWMFQDLKQHLAEHNGVMFEPATLTTPQPCCRATTATRCAVMCWISKPLHRVCC